MGYEYSDFKVILGTLYSVDEEYVIIVTDLDDDVTDREVVYRGEVSKFSSAKFYKYDTDEEPVEITALEGDSVEVLGSLSTHEEVPGEGARVLVHLIGGTVKSVTVIE